MENVYWDVVEFHRLFSEKVPNEAGIYALVSANRLLGIPVSARPVYVGKSKNLRRHFVQHLDPLQESNSLLYSIAVAESLEFWFAPLPKEDIHLAEKIAIRVLQPLANVIRYKQEN